MPKVLQPIWIDLDKSRSLVLDWNALSVIEAETGESTFSARFWQRMGAKKVRAVLWAALLHETPDITIEQVGNLLDLDNLNMVVCKLAETFNAHVAPPKKESEKAA
jgi:hypothetical protein